MASKENQEALDYIRNCFHEGWCLDDEKFIKTLNTLQQAINDLNDCRNELCLHCGKYKNEHLGACEGCRWKH